MDRRNFLKFFALGSAAVTIPVTTAVVTNTFKKEKKPPTPVKPIADKTNWQPATGISCGPYYRPTLDMVDENMVRCQMTVGADGCLWIKPHKEDEWFRVAMENNYV